MTYRGIFEEEEAKITSTDTGSPHNTPTGGGERNAPLVDLVWDLSEEDTMQVECYGDGHQRADRRSKALGFCISYGR